MVRRRKTPGLSCPKLGLEIMPVKRRDDFFRCLNATLEQTDNLKRQCFVTWIARIDSCFTTALVEYLMKNCQLLWANAAIKSHGAVSQLDESTLVGFQASVCRERPDDTLIIYPLWARAIHKDVPLQELGTSVGLAVRSE
jgi:hypothetical protein